MIDLSACPISLDPSERQKLEELARQLPLIAELSACELLSTVWETTAALL